MDIVGTFSGRKWIQFVLQKIFEKMLLHNILLNCSLHKDIDPSLKIFVQIYSNLQTNIDDPNHMKSWHYFVFRAYVFFVMTCYNLSLALGYKSCISLSDM